MSLLQVHNVSQPKYTINAVPQGWSKLCVRLVSQQSFLGHAIKSKQPTTTDQFSRLRYQQKVQLGRRGLPQCAMDMGKMEVTNEQIRQEKQRIVKEEVFLGKEELLGISENGAEAGPAKGKVGSQMQECWELWQRIGLPVQKIAKDRHMTETGVFFCIFTCIQNNFTVDWYELCKEAKFTSDIAKRMIQATENHFPNAASGQLPPMRILRQHLPSDISDIHFGLFVTMLGRGLPYETIKDISFQTRGSKAETEWGEEYADEERFPKEATESRLLQWFSKKDGVSLIEIVLKFRECDDMHLLRLLLKMEEDGKILWRQGIFRANYNYKGFM